MKIGFFEIENWEKEIIQKKFPKDKIIFSKGKLTKKHKDLEIISIFIHSKVDEKLLRYFPKLKLISTRSTGFNHIDVEACQKRKIKVSNVPTYGEHTVAEHTFALILSLTRKINECIQRTKQGDFNQKGLRGLDLKGKNLGIIGCGNIGEHVAKIAKGFEMNVLVHDLYQDKKLAKKFNFKYSTLNNLLKKADIVTLHLPLTKHTKHLINQKKLALMKPTAYLINTSRGPIIDTDALFTALKNKRLAGVGLDVLEEECRMLEEKQLLKKDFAKEFNFKTMV